MEGTCVVAIRQGERDWLALEVCIKDADLYVNYFAPDGTPAWLALSHWKKAHTSYHASGQQHIKKGRDYVYWTDGPAGEWCPIELLKQPPGTVADREECSTIGWMIGELDSKLPLATIGADMVVDGSALPRSSYLVFEVSVVGPATTARTEVLGFQVLQRHRVSNGLVVEIEAISTRPNRH